MTSNGRFHPLLSDPLPTVPLDVGINTDKVKRRAHKMTTTNDGGMTDDRKIRLADELHLGLHHAHAEPLAAEITGLLRRLIEDTMTFMIIEIGSSYANRYLQFLTYDGTAMLAESVGDENLHPGFGLTGAERQKLLRLGWNPPQDGPHNGNYWRQWEPPSPFDAGQLAALTLLRVHNMTDPAQAVVTAADAQPPVGHDEDDPATAPPGTVPTPGSMRSTR